MDKTRWGTWEEWKQFGYSVRKGEKATMKCGQPMFSERQVDKNTQLRGQSIDYIYYDDEEVTEMDMWAISEMNY